MFILDPIILIYYNTYQNLPGNNLTRCFHMFPLDYTFLIHIEHLKDKEIILIFYFSFRGQISLIKAKNADAQFKDSAFYIYLFNRKYE